MKLYSSAIVMLVIAGMIISDKQKAHAQCEYELLKGSLANIEAVGAVYVDASDAEMPYKFMAHKGDTSIILNFSGDQEAVAFQQLLKLKSGI